MRCDADATDQSLAVREYYARQQGKQLSVMPNELQYCYASWREILLKGEKIQDEAEASLRLLSSRKTSTPSARLAALGLPADQVPDESLE